MSTRAYISIGSNIDPEQNVRASVSALRKAFGSVLLSPVYRSKAEGFDGDDFLNLVAAVDTDLKPASLSELLGEIETAHGRERGAEKFAARTLDMDLLTWGDCICELGNLRLPRDEIDRYAFVLRPLADLAPDDRHPVSRERYADLWEAFDDVGQVLWPIELDLE